MSWNPKDEEERTMSTPPILDPLIDAKGEPEGARVERQGGRAGGVVPKAARPE